MPNDNPQEHTGHKHEVNDAAAIAAAAAQQESTGNGAIDIGKNAEKIHELLAAKRPEVLMTEYNITFKKDKELGTKRESFKLLLPIPTFDGILEGMSRDEKVRDFMVSLAADAVYNAARVQVNDNETMSTQEELDLSKLTLEFIANQPKAERTGGGISKEVWEEFAKDYITVMPRVTGKPIDKIQNAATILVKKFQPSKTNKPVLKFLQEQLATWFTNTSKESQEEFQECYAFLDEKVKKLLEADEESLLANL